VQGGPGIVLEAVLKLARLRVVGVQGLGAIQHSPGSPSIVQALSKWASSKMAVTSRGSSSTIFATKLRA